MEVVRPYSVHLSQRASLAGFLSTLVQNQPVLRKVVLVGPGPRSAIGKLMTEDDVGDDYQRVYRWRVLSKHL